MKTVKELMKFLAGIPSEFIVGINNGDLTFSPPQANLTFNVLQAIDKQANINTNAIGNPALQYPHPVKLNKDGNPLPVYSIGFDGRVKSDILKALDDLADSLDGFKDGKKFSFYDNLQKTRFINEAEKIYPGVIKQGKD